MAKANGNKFSSKNTKLRCLYHKDYWHKTEHCKTLKQFFEGLVTKSHLIEYIKGAEKAKKKYSDDNYDDKMPGKRPANRVVTSVIDAIHTLTS